MQIKLITGPMASGKTTKLRSIQSELEQQGFHPLVISGPAATTQALVRSIAQQLGRCLTVLVDDCSQEQIDAINHWKARIDRDGQFADVVIHLVRQA
jgi:thymidine kinase